MRKNCNPSNYNGANLSEREKERERERYITERGRGGSWAIAFPFYPPWDMRENEREKIQ